MGRIKLAIAGGTSYAGRLADCIQKSGPEYLEISRCRDMEGLAEFLENVQPDILLCEQEAAMKEKIPDHTVKILLTGNEEVKRDEYQVIFRYQPGAEILREIFRIYGQVSEKDLVYWHKTDDLKMSAVYAPGGHEFQLAFSAAYAAICGEETHVLHLNMAEFSGMAALLGEEEGETISDLIYGIRQKREKFPFFLQSTLHHTENFDYVLPPGNPWDLYEIQGEDMENLLSLLTEKTKYHQVIWNLGTLHQLNRQIVKHCEHIWCVVKENSFGMYRKMDFDLFLNKEEGEELKQKVRYVNPQPANGGFMQSVNIWTQLQSGEFTEHVRKLIQV